MIRYLEIALISIVVPVYKAEKKIERCIDSILKQRFQNFEIIIVYKEGSDKTLDVINSINDSRIRVVHQNDDGGPGGARNIGIDLAIGDYLGFVEADDFIHKDFYYKLHKSIISDSSDIAWGEIYSKREQKFWTSNKFDSVRTIFFEKYKLIRNGASFDKLFKISLIRNNSIRFSEKIRFEDNPFLLEALYFSDKVSFVKGAIYYYNPDTWSEEYKVLLRKHILPIARRMVGFAKDNKFSKREFSLLQRKIISTFSGSFAYEPGLHNQLDDIIGNPLFFKLSYYRKRFRKYIKNLF